MLTSIRHRTLHIKLNKDISLKKTRRKRHRHLKKTTPVAVTARDEFTSQVFDLVLMFTLYDYKNMIAL